MVPNESTEPFVSVTVTILVGRNVRLARESRGWDRDRLAMEAALLDLDWDSSEIDRIERGRSAIDVCDLVALGMLLGIAPHLLLYPESGTAIEIGAASAEAMSESQGLEDVTFRAETHLGAAELADWIWNPDEHANTHVDVSERDLWTAATPERQL